MMEDFEFNKQYAAIGIIILLFFTAGFFANKYTSDDSKTLKAFEAALGKCKSYCSMENKIGFLREESQNHLKCFCWSDLDKTMENTTGLNAQTNTICFQRG